MRVVKMERLIDAHTFQPMIGIQLTIPMEWLVETNQVADSRRALAETLGEEFLVACEDFKNNGEGLV